jgi:hypothetical protein
VDKELIDQFVTTTKAWINNQRAQFEAFKDCHLSETSSKRELLNCFQENAALLNEGLRLADEVTRLQSEVLGNG